MLINKHIYASHVDEYTSEAYMYHQKFRVAPGKEVGWARLVGQEVPIDCVEDLCTVNGASQFAAAHSNLTQNVGGAAANVSPVNATITSRKLGKILNGPQTCKATQPSLEMFIPLIFWFNKDARLSIASVSIPYGQRFITIDLAPQSEIVFSCPGNIFLQLTTEVVTGADAGGAGTPTNIVAITDYQKYVTREPFLAPNSGVGSQTVDTVELYINNIFVNPEIHDIYIKRIGFSLIRVYRFQSFQVNTASNRLLLSQFKWPVETIFTGLRPSYNIDSSNTNQCRDWHRLTRLTDETCYGVCLVDGIMGTASDDSSTQNLSQLDTWLAQVQCQRCVFTNSQKTIDVVTIEAHGITLYNQFDELFFSAYQPYHYGGWNIVTPDDDGALMINFCLYPGTYQPSGHINVSRAREFYITFDSSYVTSANTADLLNLAIAINFLLISDGSAVLRYST